jgi:hypothetical protein
LSFKKSAGRLTAFFRGKKSARWIVSAAAVLHLDANGLTLTRAEGRGDLTEDKGSGEERDEEKKIGDHERWELEVLIWVTRLLLLSKGDPFSMRPL